VLSIVFGVWFPFPSHTASQATKEPAGEHRHAQGHGNVGQIKGGQKGQQYRNAQSVHSYVPVVDVRLLALATLSDHVVTREVDVGATVEAHVLVTHGTDDVVASSLPFDRGTAVATGLEGSANERFGFPQVALVEFSGGGGGTIHPWVGISVDPAKHMVANRALQAIGVGIAGVGVPIRRDELATTRTRRQ